ncbi:MAG: xanthine dehydrogenase family protein subunit M [Alphaproteobacteria bacterium]|nr:xanthine dehydrogenase family protein subunit M [Alphaproteobacteria bacterium]MCY4317841.1 xanthine dehydrogenase family protein subunit M [Alphaproteobacteria bacterium]
MYAPSFAAPTTVADAVQLLANASGVTRVLAGGTDLLVQLRSGILKPDLIVDTKRIPELRTITTEGGGYRIGASVSGAEAGEHAALSRDWPGVVEAVELIGSTQIQGRASFVGNLCNASPAADAVPALVAAGATVVIAGPNGEREIAVEQVPTGPGRTSLAKGEMVIAVKLPPKPVRTGDAYLRFIPRTEMDIAVVGAGVCVTLDGQGVCRAAKVSLGAVAPTVLVVSAAAAALVGSKLDDAALATLDAAAQAACNPISDKRGTIEYRTRVAGVLSRRAAAIAFKRAGA